MNIEIEFYSLEFAQNCNMETLSFQSKLQSWFCILLQASGWK